MIPAGNKAKRLSSVNHNPKTIHHQFSSIQFIIYLLRAIPLSNTTQYLSCQLDSKLRGEALTSKVLRKINAKLKFLYRKSINLTPAFRRLLGNALTQPHFG